MMIFGGGKRYNSWEKVDDMLISAISVALWLNIERKLKKCSLILYCEIAHLSASRVILLVFGVGRQQHFSALTA